MNVDIQTVINQSIQRKDGNGNASGSISDWLTRSGVDVTMRKELPLEWTKQKDLLLSRTVAYHDQWRNAVEIGATKFAAHDWTVTSEQNELQSRLQSILLYSNFGAGWVQFATALARSYLLRGNGFFIEIIRANKAASSKVVGLAVLDADRCTRTGDPEYPVFYIDVKGGEHTLGYWQVIVSEDNRFVQHSDSMSAAEAVYKTVYKMCAIEARIAEVESASSFTGIDFVGGVAESIITDAVENAEEKRRATGQIYHKGRLIVPTMGDVSISHKGIDLIDRPPADNLKLERLRADLIYANAIGFAPRELNPENTSRVGLNSGKSEGSSIELSKARGLSALVKNFTHAVNMWVAPLDTNFTMTMPSLGDDVARETLRGLQIENAASAGQ